MNATISSPCPQCGATLPQDLYNGVLIFPCPSCGQLVHPGNCLCETCQTEPFPDDDLSLLKLGMFGLASMRALRRQDEAERARLGLPPSTPKQSQPTIIETGNGGRITITGNVGAMKLGPDSGIICPNCGKKNVLDARFCCDCGTNLIK